MPARVIALRPRPRRVPTRPSPSPSPSSVVPGLDERVSVEWDEARELYVVACRRCTETVLSNRLEEGEELAEAHRCDPELAALLADITGEAA
ncbi:hypothetical protein [Actinomadura sp. HBU206391]|uniref:hypothetical protein n=1 Tax=Actinomadura sp. HBU206391 TaxID=2731692 RepID=UPI001650399E|nr:hypothetical protein [Actinomadura sp. HBU206391]MBC6462417.1 hypothetical protein [Actinomadura sp. HBU206391]